MSLTSKLDAYIREHKSGECWEIEGSDEQDRKVYVSVPREILNLHDALADIAEEFGAPCDLHLTDTGALLVFWLPSTWTRPVTESKKSRTWIFSAMLVVVASIVAVATPIYHNSNITDNASDGNAHAGARWFSIW